MKLEQCPNKHFYDSDLFTACPYCGSAIDTVQETGSRNPEVPEEKPAVYTGRLTEEKKLMEPVAYSEWSKNSDRTVGYYTRSIGVEPVVGWLVAVSGPYFGEDFRLKSGRNFIGRSAEMDVQLILDPSVSRRRHAIVVYEPKKRVFIAQPGDSHELCYLNDEVVLTATEMKDRDILMLGETSLMLVSLCGDGFKWEDIENTSLS